METHEIQENGQGGAGLAWVAALLVSFYCVCAYVFLLRSTEIFIELFGSIGVELPLATKLLIPTYSWLYPLFFVGAAVLVIAKEYVLRDVRHRLTATVIISAGAISLAGLVQYALNLPLRDLVQKLNQIK